MSKGRPKKRLTADLDALFTTHKSVRGVAKATGISANTIRSRARREGVKLPGESGNRVLLDEQVLGAVRLHARTWYEADGSLVLISSELGSVAKNNAALHGVDIKTFRDRLEKLGRSNMFKLVNNDPVFLIPDSDISIAIATHFSFYVRYRIEAVLDVVAKSAPEGARVPDAVNDAIFQIYLSALKVAMKLTFSTEADYLLRKFGSVRLFEEVLTTLESFAAKSFQALPLEIRNTIGLSFDKIVEALPAVNQPEEQHDYIDGARKELTPWFFAFRKDI